jgi:chlorobactene glucosyltransferase
MSVALALTSAVPWLLFPPLAMLRVTRSRSLSDEEPSLPANPPRVSVIVPARNEARNIGRCIGSILATTYPDVQVILVDDHSTDETAPVARDAGNGDPRLVILANPDLPNGWFGKQWACANGAAIANGQLLVFTDADTEHRPDLLTRAVSAMLRDRAHILSIAGQQVTLSFWERVVQPQVFWMLLARYGGTESISKARRAEAVIASGQFLVMSRETYDAIGGHESVRSKVAEDLALAQRVFRRGGRVRLIRGEEQLKTHMYASLSELVHGWGKNVFAGGIDAVPGGAVGRALFPFLLPLMPLMSLVPIATLVLAWTGLLGSDWLLWSTICTVAGLFWWALIYRGFQQRLWYALLYPLGASVVLFIILRAIARGRRVGWKGREYVAH